MTTILQYFKVLFLDCDGNTNEVIFQGKDLLNNTTFKKFFKKRLVENSSINSINLHLEDIGELKLDALDKGLVNRISPDEKLKILEGTCNSGILDISNLLYPIGKNLSFQSLDFLYEFALDYNRESHLTYFLLFPNLFGLIFQGMPDSAFPLDSTAIIQLGFNSLKYFRYGYYAYKYIDIPREMSNSYINCHVQNFQHITCTEPRVNIEMLKNFVSDQKVISNIDREIITVKETIKTVGMPFI